MNSQYSLYFGWKHEIVAVIYSIRCAPFLWTQPRCGFSCKRKRLLGLQLQVGCWAQWCRSQGRKASLPFGRASSLAFTDSASMVASVWACMSPSVLLVPLHIALAVHLPPSFSFRVTISWQDCSFRTPQVKALFVFVGDATLLNKILSALTTGRLLHPLFTWENSTSLTTSSNPTYPGPFLRAMLSYWINKHTLNELNTCA
jgi:hypothetical protein